MIVKEVIKLNLNQQDKELYINIDIIQGIARRFVEDKNGKQYSYSLSLINGIDYTISKDEYMDIRRCFKIVNKDSRKSITRSTRK